MAISDRCRYNPLQAGQGCQWLAPAECNNEWTDSLSVWEAHEWLDME